MESIVKYNVNGDIETLQRTAKMLAMSGYFDAKGDMSVQIAQMATKILAGAELGYGPFAAVNGIHVIQGKPAIGANLMAAAVKNHPRYDYRVKKMADDEVTLEFFEIVGGKRESLGVSSFTKKDAEAAGLLKNPTWKNYPRNMAFARAMSNGVRWFCPDVFNGNSVYVPEELGATVDGDGNVVDATWQQQNQPETVQIATNGTHPEEDFGGTGEDNPFADAPSPTERTIISGWQSRDDAYQWAVDNGHCKAIPHAKNSMEKLINEQFGGKVTVEDKDRVFLAFLRHQVSKSEPVAQAA